MNSRRYSADGIRGSAQRPDPRPLGGLHVEELFLSVQLELVQSANRFSTLRRAKEFGLSAGHVAETWRMTIGLTWRRTVRRIKRLKETVLAISPDYSIARPPTFWRSRLRACLKSLMPERGG